MSLHPVLTRSPLFRSMTDDEIIAALRVMETKERVYERAETVLRAGETPQRMGFVFQGSVTIERSDVWGNRTALSRLEAGSFFAETAAALPEEPLPDDIVAAERTHILFFRIEAIREPRHLSESWAVKLTANLLALSMQTSLALSARIEHTTPKTIRGRVMAYLNSVAQRKHSRSFDIPFSRQELADYLNVERSALSKELSKMAAEGLIETKKNRFRLIGTEADAVRD